MAGEEDPLVGELLLGQFRIVEKIGRGACGSVYRAWQIGVERDVAIKVLHEEAAKSPEFSIRFTREAQATARLASPNIITIYSLGHTAAGLPFMAMEWVNGYPLGAEPGDIGLVRHALYSAKEAVDIGKQIASALVQAHAAGVIHRDLKPDNVLVSKSHGRPVVTVLDFGIAKLLDRHLMKPGESQLTRQGAVYGTPAYLSPEQAGGTDVDARSDLYSVGVILYELLVGKRPFESVGVALLLDHVSGVVPDLQERAPHIPAPLAALVMRLLAKDPENRVQSAIALYEALDSISFVAPICSESPAVLEDFAFAKTSLHNEALVPKRRLGRRSLFAALLASGLIAFGTNSENNSVAEGNHVGAVTAKVLPVQSVAETEKEIQPVGPRRAMMLSSGGYALRVLVPTQLTVHTDEQIAIELWDPKGRPVDLPAMAVVFTDAKGVEHGVSARSGTQMGRYEIRRRFEQMGAHSMQIFPEGVDATLRLHFEVESAPNS